MEGRFSSFVPSPIVTRNLPKVRSSVGSSPRSGLQEERYEQLKIEFSDLDRDKNNVLTFDEIRDFLSEKQGNQFDLGLCQDLFARMDKNHDNEISLEEFVESYVEIEELIVRQVRALGKDIKKSRNEIEETSEKLKKAAASERTTSVGIMQGSVLTVTVKSARDLFLGASDANNFVVLQCNGQSVETGTVAGLFPTWDESFSFPITSKEHSLQLTIMNRGMFGNKFIGKISVPLSVLNDQLKHEQYFTLQAETEGEKWQGKVCLELQWIWSKVKYYQDIMQEWENILNADQEKLENLKTQLERLRKPFGLLKGFEARSEVVTPTSRTIQIEERLVQKFEEITQGKISFVIDNEKYLYLSLVIYMVIGIFVNFLRPDFVNVRLI